MDQSSYATLLLSYLDICNQALAANASRFPFDQILHSAQQKDRPETIEIHIVDDYFTPRFRVKIAQNALGLSTCAGENGCCRACVKREWHVPSSYLKDVTNNPQAYIDNPALLNWEWLQPDETDHLSLHGKPEEQAEQL